MVVGNAIADAEPDVTDMVVTVASKVGVKGFAPLEPRDQIFSAEGVSARALSSSRGLRAMGELLFNPFEPVVLDRMDVDVRVDYRRDVAEIVGVSLPGQEVHAGDTVPLRVTLRPYAGAEYVETVPVIVPRTVARRARSRSRSRPGSVVRPDVPQAESLRGYIDNMRKSYSASSIVVTLQTPDDGASLRGRLMQGLPASALDTLRPANQTRRADAYRIADRTVYPMRQLVSGKQELTIQVKDDVLGASVSSAAGAQCRETSARAPQARAADNIGPGWPHFNKCPACDLSLQRSPRLAARRRLARRRDKTFRQTTAKDFEEGRPPAAWCSRRAKWCRA